MDPVPQKVLNWLHSVLIGEYHDVNRTYSDVAQTLSEHKSLKPSTDVYTFENGRSSLLLHLTGTIPVSFRGSTFYIPISLWVPQPYPREFPIAFVTPTSNMRVRPGQHVSGEGRIYHPYLANWRPDRSSIAELLRILQDIFAREPPVIAKQAPANPAPPRPQQGGPPPVPPLPPELAPAGDSSRPQTMSPSQAPPPPPKPFQEQRRSSALVPNDPSRLGSRPHGDTQAGVQSIYDGGRQPPVPDYQPQSSSANHRYSQPPPLPPQQEQRRTDSTYNQRGPVSPVSPVPTHGIGQWSQQHSSVPNYQQGYAVGPPQSMMPQSMPPQHQPPFPTSYPATYAPPQQRPSYSQHAPEQAPPQPRPQPAPDLLSDPFDPPLPTSSEPLPAPAVPPNPEKDALLSALSSTLTSQLHSLLSSNAAALQPLYSQHAALNASFRSLQSESSALSSLATTLAQNEQTLHNAMRESDAVIQRAQTMKVPGVDEVLVAPTVVGQQMYELVAEENACAEAREVLGRALDRGRIGAEGWVRAMRGLGREEFGKKVLVKKAASGMGLVGAVEEKRRSSTSAGGNWI